jgi:predicted hydrocarbon binding protein
MAKNKGTVLVALKAFIRERFGEEAWLVFLDSLDQDDRLEVELPLSIRWYDLVLMQRVFRKVDELLGDNDCSLIELFGRYEAERDLRTVHRMFLKMANPAYTLEKAGQYWRRFCDFGEWHIVRNGKKGATARFVGCPIVDALYCAELQGYFTRILELVGAKNVSVSHDECRANGDANCLFVGTWD